ncbi:hypothetical protein RYX36_012103 [Vicia faba]
MGMAVKLINWWPKLVSFDINLSSTSSMGFRMMLSVLLKWFVVLVDVCSKGKTIAVVVLDGWGEANPNEYNCIHIAETPTMDSLKKGAPEHWRLVRAHGKAVGLPTEDDMGNSEVGHNALGAGRIFA